MTAKQFNAALDKLGFTQMGFARKLELGKRSVRRWAMAGADAGRDAAEPDALHQIQPRGPQGMTHIYRVSATRDTGYFGKR